MAHTTITRKEALAPLHEEEPDYVKQCWGITEPEESPQPLPWRASQLASYWFDHAAHDDVEAFLTWLPITIGGKPIDDPYPEWHDSTTDFALITRLHLIRLYHNWEHETALCKYLDADPTVLDALGVDTAPNQSTLYTAWHDRFTDTYQETLDETVEIVVDVARDNDVSVPERALNPEPETPSTEEQERSARSERRLARKKTKEVWQTAKPLVGAVVALDRPDKTEIHDNAFLELHTYLGCREELYAETGAGDFAEDTTRRRTPTGSYHRNCIRSLSVKRQRRNHRRAMTEVIARARQQNRLAGKQTTAIDITAESPFNGKRETEALKREIIGTKEANSEVAYQYATIQVVGGDLPVVLDGIPVEKGMSRAEIVEELLAEATEMVDIDLVLMDREFDSSGVKDACEEYNVHYLNPSKMFREEKLAAKELSAEEIRVSREESSAADQRPPRKRLWLPKSTVKSDELVTDGGEESDCLADIDPETAEAITAKKNIRKELGEEFLESVDEPDEAVVDWALGTKLLPTLEERAYKESYAVDDDGIQHIVFETNHPELSVPEGKTDETGIIHRIARFTRQYGNRWGIESGYNKTKSFMAKTTSKDQRYRFFNFIFACLLYSLWRLVDLLVKRSLGDDESSPRVRGSTFLTIAKKEYGLEPPT
jgi:putative transposase